MIRVSGKFQYREDKVYVWLHLRQNTATLPIVSGPTKYSHNEWSRILRDYTEVRWEEIPSPLYQSQQEIGN